MNQPPFARIAIWVGLLAFAVGLSGTLHLAIVARAGIVTFALIAGALGGLIYTAVGVHRLERSAKSPGSEHTPASFKARAIDLVCVLAVSMLAGLTASVSAV